VTTRTTERALGMPAWGLLVALMAAALLVATALPGVAAEDAFPITVVDDEGTEVTVEAYPERIISLSPANTETVYALGAGDRLVGGTDYDDYPPEAAEVTDVATFTGVIMEQVVALEPDLVLAFSDLQADIVADLIRHGIAVHCFNQRDAAGIFDMVLTLGALVDAREEAAALVNGWRGRIGALKASAPEVRPRVYFEEWDEPMITGIGWVSELIEVAGGEDCFARLRTQQAAKDRIISPDEVISAAPDIIIGSWCGKKFRPEKVAARPGWDAIPAVRDGQLHEIKSPLILQPGSAALTDGLDGLVKIITAWTSIRA
jgi:iron complex transport system substrate-binding protein